METSKSQWSFIKYKEGTYITLKDYPSKGTFYIIREGEVSVKRESLIEQGDSLGSGDFINLVPALTGHNCEESALAITDVTVISVNKKSLEELIKVNATIALKILKLFSKRLRQYDNYIESSSGKKQKSDNAAEYLYNTAKFYYSESKLDLARYAFQKCIDLYPNSEYLSDIEKTIEIIGPLKNTIDPTKGVIKVEDGQFIFCESEPGDRFYFIRSGNIKITKVIGEKETVFSILNPGNFFGEMAILEDKGRNANAITMGEVELMAISKNAFKPFIEKQTEVVMRLINILAERIWIVSQRVESTTLKDPIAKIYDTLIALLKKEHIDLGVKESYAYVFDFTLNDLADISGVDKDLLPDILAVLEKDKVISEIQGKIYIDDIKNLDLTARYYKAFDSISKKKSRTQTSI